MALSGLVVGIVDAHLHQWNPRHTPWSAIRGSRFYRVAPSLGDRVFPLLVSPADREYVLNSTTVARRHEPAQYLSDAVPVHNVAGVPIDTVVYVESHWRSTTSISDGAPEGLSAEDEVRYVTGLPFGVGGAPRLGAIVVHGDPRALGFAARLDRQMSESDVVRGVRWGVARHPDPRVRDFGDADGILASPSFLSGFAAVAERGLSFDVSLYSHQLYDAVTLAREYPETTFVLDHIGAPVGVFGPVGAPNASMDMIVGSLLDILDDRGDYLLQCLFRENALRVYRI